MNLMIYYTLYTFIQYIIEVSFLYRLILITLLMSREKLFPLRVKIFLISVASELSWRHEKILKTNLKIHQKIVCQINF